MSPKPVLNQINMVVRDMDAAVAFYRRLGLKIPDYTPEWDAHHRSADVDGHLLPEDAGDDVHRAARGRRNDEPHGPLAKRPDVERERPSNQRHYGACQSWQFHLTSPV